MAERIFNVLFLCTGNTARSILAESILRKVGAGRFAAYSAGSHPKGVVNPFALKVLERLEFPIDGLRSKNWQEFSRPGAPTMDFVFTLCDDAAQEACPVWPGQPMTAHWGRPRRRRGNGHSQGSGVRRRSALREEPDFRFRRPADQEPRQVVVDREAQRDRGARRGEQAALRGRVMDFVVRRNPACRTSRGADNSSRKTASA
jgi:protein-tyrosine-phosphatase